jgi:predicted nucleic acid-binding protein
MLSAIDTNIISSLWSQESASKDVASILFKCKQEGGLVIAAPVYAELLAHPKATKTFIDNFLNQTGIQVHFELSKEVWLKAGEAFADYAMRRRQAKSKEAKRLLIDFLIGAHASLAADRLLSLDKNRYETGFPTLKVLSP